LDSSIVPSPFQWTTGSNLPDRLLWRTRDQIAGSLSEINVLYLQVRNSTCGGFGLLFFGLKNHKICAVNKMVVPKKVCSKMGFLKKP